MSLLLFLSTDDAIPLHRRLIAALTEAITSSRLAPGALVPSSRELAQSLGIARATVSKAYEELVRSGYLITRQGGKTRVAESLPTRHELGRRLIPQARGEIDALISSYAARLLELSLRTSWNQPFAAPPNWLLPIAPWKQILSKYCNNIDSSQMNADCFGEPSLRRAIAKFLARSRALDCQPEQVITFMESQSGLSYVSQVLLNEGDLVVVEDPCFINARNLFLAYGAEVLSIPVDDQGLDVDTLAQKVPADKKVKLIYVTPSFQDPCGVCMSLTRRQRLLAFAREHQASIIEDSWDGNHTFIKNVPPPIYSLSEDGNVFYLSSFWKVLYPLSMASCLVIPQRFIPYFARAKMITQEASPGVENTLQDFIESAHLEKHLKWVVRMLTPIRQQVIESLLLAFGQSVTIRKQSSAFWLTVQFPVHMDVAQILNKAAETGLLFQPTDRYYAEPQKSRHEFIVPFASIANKRLEEQ